MSDQFLPWGSPLVSSVILSMLLFAIGGWGAAINASFGMNAVTCSSVTRAPEGEAN